MAQVPATPQPQHPQLTPATPQLNGVFANENLICGAPWNDYKLQALVECVQKWHPEATITTRLLSPGEAEWLNARHQSFCV